MWSRGCRFTQRQTILCIAFPCKPRAGETSPAWARGRALEYTRWMQLRGTRLCLDCEELHEEDQCPVCASEASAFLTQWIPVEDRRRPPIRTTRPPAAPNHTRAIVGGAVGLTAVAAARW